MSKLYTFLGLALIAVVKSDFPVFSEPEDLLEASAETNYRVATRSVQYRLPENVVPLEYDIEIDLNFNEIADRPAYSYNGIVTIIIQAVEENVSQIILHANVDSINSINLFNDNGVAVFLNASQPFFEEPLYHFLRINLNDVLVVGQNYTLSIDYSSTMNEGPLKRGLWRGHYTDADGNLRIYATTHFQPYSARQAFPCWDEPAFKAVFTLHLTRATSYQSVYSNTRIQSATLLENSRVRNNFLPTPKMSSYLLTFLVSDSFAVIGEDTSFDPPIRIIGRSNAVGLANQSLEYAVELTKHFDEYFEIPYNTLHPNLHNDHISSPDWASAGTENWGMVSYRELYMILDPEETIMSVEHYATTLVAHELAHKWFGNLITCYWWSNTWINEGFASYFGYIAGHAMFPKYELTDHFNSRYLQNTLSTDSGVSSVPMNHEVNTPAEVTGHFGVISYSKAAAFLRQTVDLIGEEAFRNACRYFLLDNAYEPTDQYHLRAAFEQAISEVDTLDGYTNFNFTDYYTVWVNEAGYPLLTVDVDYTNGEISLVQERYFLSATATPTGQIYPLPVTFSSASNPAFTDLKPVYVMTTERAVLTKPVGEEWVIFNNMQRGLYRVNYSERNWELLAEALLQNVDSIHYLNRAQIVDDVFAFMRSGHLTYSYGFNILRFLRNDSNYHVWDAAITGFTWLRNRLRHIPESQATFDNTILSLMENAINTLGFDVDTDETPTVSMTRQIILHFACTLEHQRCVEESKTRFASLKSGVWIDPKIRRNVYVVGIREGDESDFEFLLNRYQQSNYANDQLEMMRALAATKDASLLTRYMEWTLTDDIRFHDKSNAFSYGLLGNLESAYVILQFVKNNIDAIRVQYVTDAQSNFVQTCLSNLAAYLDESGLVEYEEWLQSTQVGSSEYASALSAINSARTNMAWGTANADTIISALPEEDASSTGGAAQIIASSAMLMILVVLAVAA